MKFPFLTKLLAALPLLTISAILAGCGGGGSSEDGELRIVATTTMIADMAREVAGEKARVIGLMAPGVDPHTYTLPARSIADLRSADVVLYSGLKLEGRTEETYSARKDEAVVRAVTEKLPENELIFAPGFEGHPDPHVWGDPQLWSRTVPVVVEALCEADPEGAEEYKARGEAYLKKIESLTAWISDKVSTLPEENRILITSHDAFNYLGRAFDLEVIGVQGISTASEAGMADISKTADLIKERGVRALFVESSVNPAAIERISANTGVKIGGELYSDSLGPAGTMETSGEETWDAGTYIGMMKHNIHTIVEALK